MWTRKALSSLFVIICLTLALQSVIGEHREKAPDFTLTDIDDVDFTLSDHVGKVVLVDFTSTVCAPCVYFQAELKMLRANFTESELVMISVSVYEGDTEQDIRDFKSQHGGNWAYAKDTADLETIYDVHYTPLVYIIDVDGYIYSIHRGNRSWEVIEPDIIAAMSGYEPPDVSPVIAGEVAQDFSIVDIGGNTFSLSDNLGKVVLIDFFMIDGPSSGAMREELKVVREDNGEDELIMISIGIGNITDQDVYYYKENHGGNWTYARDTQGLWTQYGVTETPTLVVVDVDGNVEFHNLGVTQSANVQDAVEDGKSGYQPPPVDDDDSDDNIFFLLLAGGIAVLIIVGVVLTLVFRRKGEKKA